MVARKSGKSGIELLKMFDKYDIAVVVRCKDCKHRGTSNCVSYEAFWELGDDGFCSAGERKEEEEDVGR